MSVDAGDFTLDVPQITGNRDRGVMLSNNDIAAAILSTLGGVGCPVDPMEDGYQFVRHYGLKFDGKLMTGPNGLDGDYKHLRPVYEDTALQLVLMAGAQTGKTAALVTHMVRVALGHAWGQMMGFYFPNKDLPIAFSRGRFKPFLRTNPAIRALLGATIQGEAGQDATLTMSIGETILHLLTIGGKTATESLPFKALYFDEVRRMVLGDIERAHERASAQRDAVNVKVSTARFPESDIHHWYLKGDQREFHTGCRCADGVTLTGAFPDCIADLRNCTPLLRNKVAHAYSHAGVPWLGMTEIDRQQYPEAAYMCPKCGEILVDPRDGWWEPHGPDVYTHSYQFAQLHSVTYPAGRVLHKYEENVDYQEFMNSCLGLPYVDKEKMPVQAHHVQACVDDRLQWGEQMADEVRKRRLTNCAMGIDVQAGYGICVIKARGASGKGRVVHLEVLRNPGEDKTWWYRAGQLMYRYDVRYAVVEEAPEFNEAQLFCDAFPGRAYLGNVLLGDNSKYIVEWHDKTLAKDQKQKGDSATRMRVSVQRTKGLHWSLMAWKNRQNEIPHLDSLRQPIPQIKGKPVFSAHLRNGVDAPTAVGRILQDHLTRFVFRDLLDDDPEKARLGQRKWVAEYVGSSPDFAFANLYCDVALDRIGRSSGVRRLGS